MTNIAAGLSETARRSAGDVALVFEDSSYTFAELESAAARVAGALSSLGVGAGDHVALWMGNHPAFVTTMYGVWRLGAVAVPLHALLTEPEARHILVDSEAKVVFTGAAQHSLAASISAEASAIEHVVCVEGEASELDDLTASADEVAMADADDDALALIGYTSGTSGLAKGAMLSHGNLSSNLEQMRATPIATRSDDVILCILPLFHIYGLNVVLNLSLRLGSKLVLHERFDPAGSVTAIAEHAVTRIAGAPPAYVAWLGLPDLGSDAFSTVRVAVSGAAPLPKAVLSGFADRFGVTIWEGYGLTETSPGLTTTAMGGVAKAGSVGRPLPGIEIRLIDQDGADVEEGDPGEIVVRGPNVFSGYWNQPTETTRAFVDGWFRTGDVAVADDDGDLFLVDRRRDLIIVSGFNVYPREVEDVLRRHPSVGDVAVVGDPDPETGERVHAIVVASGERPTAEDLIAFCRKSLAPYKIPTRVELTTEIPRNAAGKVLRRVLRD